MLKKLIFFGACAPFYFIAPAQQPAKPAVDVSTFANTITVDEMKAKMAFIAGDEFAGRETGEQGQKLCGIYLANHFKNLGLPATVNAKNSPSDSAIKAKGWMPPTDLNGYMQSFPLREEKTAGYNLVIGGKPFTFLTDYFAFQGIPDQLYTSNKIVFVGYGINDQEKGINEYKGLDVKGKVVLFFEDEPMDRSGNSLVTGSKKLSEWTTDLKLKTNAAKNAGAIAILSVQKYAAHDIEVYRHYIEKPKTYPEGKSGKQAFPKFFISEQMADFLFALENKKHTCASLRDTYRNGKPAKGFEIETDFSVSVKTELRKITGENILGYIEGTDLKDELIVITAHYDHLGKTQEGIYYGADDDGSGTVSLMEIAEAFVAAKKAGYSTRRSILIMPVSGEEKGLLGSEYYAENPVFPLKNTVANINIDMIGRVDKEHEGNYNYLYVIGADRISQDLHDVNEAMNKKYSNLELDYTFNDPKDPNMFYYRSDHYNFAKNGVPSVFFFTGVHDDYHKITDTPDKLHYEKMAKIARHIFYTAWELANRDERPRITVKE